MTTRESTGTGPSLRSSLSVTFAPTLPALLNDFVFQYEMALGKSISVLAAINYTIGAVCIGFGLRYFRRALKTAEAWH